MIRRLAVTGQVKPLCGGAEAKASLNRANKSVAADAKPRELRMGRMKRENELSPRLMILSILHTGHPLVFQH